MAHVDVDQPRTSDRPPVTPTASQGLAAFAATAALDAASTVAGLSLAPVLVETNPIARALFSHFGVVLTVVVVSAIAGLVVFAVTELAVRVVRANARRSRSVERIVRVIGYGTPSVVSLVVAINNLALLAKHATLVA